VYADRTPVGRDRTGGVRSADTEPKENPRDLSLPHTPTAPATANGRKVAPPPAPPTAPSRRSSPTDYTADFEEAWTVYPRKVGKKAAARAWNATVRRAGRTVVPQLKAAAQHYANDCRARRTEEKFIKHAATFYGPDEHWSDYVTGRVPSARREPRPGDPDFLPESLRG
jgi:hypothetical protein